jgi:hypothetical protein
MSRMKLMSTAKSFGKCRPDYGWHCRVYNDRDRGGNLV